MTPFWPHREWGNPICRAFCEQMLDAGCSLFIIDPEGENYTLAEHYPLLIIGGEHANFQFDLDTATREECKQIIETILDAGASIIFDLSGRLDSQKQRLFALIVGTLFLVQNNPARRRPTKLIVEEARVFAPQKETALPLVDGETSLSV